MATKSNELLDELLSSAYEEPVQSKFEEEDQILAPLLDEINQINNEYLRSFVRCMLLNLPEEFWTIPIPAEPDMHPLDEYHNGGLVLHTKRVVRAAVLIGEIQFRPIEDIDILIAAAILHDVAKSDVLVPDYLHPMVVDKMLDNISTMDELDVEYHTRSNVLDFIVNCPEFLIIIMRMIRTHEGIESPCPEFIPVTTMESMLNIANQVAKNIDKIVDGYEIKIARWELNGSESEDIETDLPTGTS